MATKAKAIYPSYSTRGSADEALAGSTPSYLEQE